MNSLLVLIFLWSATEAFYTAFTPALFAAETVPVENAIAFHFAHRGGYARKYHHSVEPFWLNYLARRCRNEKTDESVGRYAEIRAVAARLVRHQKTTREGNNGYLDDYDIVLRELCRLALYRGVMYHGYWEGWGSWAQHTRKWSSPKGSLLSAACYFGCLSLVKDLVAEGGEFGSTLFASPTHLAAWAGQTEVLQFLLERPEAPEIEMTTGRWAHRRVKRLDCEALVGAATRGDLDLVKFVLYTPSRTISSRVEPTNFGSWSRVPDSTLIMGYEPGSIEQGVTQAWNYIQKAKARTPSPQIYTYLDSLLSSSPRCWKEPEHDVEGNNYILAQRVALGDVVMVRHLLDIGADAVDVNNKNNLPALVEAVHGWHEDVVDLLLERGADPNFQGPFPEFPTPLRAAARAGSMVMLRKLLDAGGKFEEEDLSLNYAIMHEHTAMAELLLSRGVGSEQERSWLLDMAQDEGMDSMVDLLKSWGVSSKALVA